MTFQSAPLTWIKASLMNMLEKIMLDPRVLPVVHPPRKVAVSLKEKIKDELDRMEKQA